MAVSNVLSVQKLHKNYGKLIALNQLDLKIESGQVFGLLGPNGSGKSTCLGMLLGVTNPSSGEFVWFDEKADTNNRKRIGAILEKPNFYENYNALQNLKIVCKIKGIEYSRIDEELKRVGLFERRNDAFKTYSLGMKQRLAIASALLADPEVLILDEPTNGLDPQGISDIRELILKISQSGKTIILASHLLDEVQKVCSHFAVLRKGNLIHHGPVGKDLDDSTNVEVGSQELQRLEKSIIKFNGYVSHKNIKHGYAVKLTQGKSASNLNEFLQGEGILINHLVTIEKTLEQQFLEILEANV
jgi:ABC-type multidrug transport system ATPase subunit